MPGLLGKTPCGSYIKVVDRTKVTMMVTFDEAPIVTKSQKEEKAEKVFTTIQGSSIDIVAPELPSQFP